MFTCPLSGRRGASARRTFFAALVACCLLLQQSASAFAPQTSVRKRAGAAPSPGRKGAKPSVPTGLLVPGTASTVFINEIHYDNTGTDAGEFIEVAGPAGTNLTGWSIVLYNGNGGASYDTDALTGTIPSQQGGYGTVSISYPSNGIQNGSPDGVALVDGTTLVQFLCYEGTFAATNGPANGQTCTDIGVSEDGTEATGNSLQLTGSGDNYGDFTWTGPTAATQNSPNTGQTFAAATPTPTPGGLPALSIDDVSQDEGDSGQTNFTFTVSSDQTSDGSIVFNICTQDGTAQDASGTGEDDDYNLFCLTNQSIPNGQTSSQFSVQVNGDTEQESDETFLVNITQLSGATAADGQGVGTIQNDDIALVLISQVQGSGASSPLVGQTVSVRGVVTLIKSNGFFVQEEVGDNDSDPNTSEGVFVFTSSAPPISVGDNVTVTGEVVEFNGLTEISTPGGGIVVTNSTGNTLPTAVTIDTTILDPAAGPTQPQLEKYEGMRMTAASLTTVAPNDNFFDVYTVLSSVARPMREPGIPASDPVPPDPTSGTPDPNIPSWDENPERLIVDTNGRAGSTNTAYTSNVTFTNVAGPLDFSFGAYRLVPEAALTASANMSAVPVPTPAAGEFLVAGYNIENFNNDATQREKAALTIRDVMHLPAIIGVAEIFDLADLQELAAEVDLMSGGTTAYEARLVEQDGTSEDSDQDVGFLVDTARVSITSTTVERASDTFINPNDGQPETLHDRPPFVLRAVVDPSGAALPVIVVVNHTRSFIDIELVAGEGARVRAKRKAQAESIAGLLQELQTNNPGVPVIAVGDYNAFQFNNGYDDPVSVMKGNPTPDDQIVVDQSPDVVDPNFANLIDDLPAAEQYSFIFEGTPQALDHVLVNTAARARNTRVAVGRVNADFPEAPAAAFASDASRPERNSDHDPVVAYFTLAERHPPGSFIITEFRFRGPGLAPGGDTAAAGRPLKRRGGKARPERADDPASNDEFIEFYNNTDSDIEVSTSDGSDGWALVASDGVVRFVIPNGTVIPARNYYLAVNENGYSLGNAGPGAEGDFFYTADIPDGAGIAIFRTSNPANFTESERLDAAGYASAPALYREGAGLDTGPGDAVGGAETTSDLEHSFVRTMDRRTTGRPKDINDNADDFVLVMTEPNTSTSPTAVLGAPGPQGMEAPKEMNAQFPISLIDPQRTTAEPPNRTRNLNDSRGLNGTMALRKTITNETGQDIGFLRFRIVEFTTFNSAQLSPQQAELISINSEDGDLDFCSDFEVQITGGSTVEVHGTSREEPPAQPNGGGLNSTLIAICAPLPGETTIAEGASFNVEFLFAVNRPGNFRFFINVEALPVQTQQPSKPSVRGLRKTASPALKGGRLRP